MQSHSVSEKTTRLLTRMLSKKAGQYTTKGFSPAPPIPDSPPYVIPGSTPIRIKSSQAATLHHSTTNKAASLLLSRIPILLKQPTCTVPLHSMPPTDLPQLSAQTSSHTTKQRSTTLNRPSTFTYRRLVPNTNFTIPAVPPQTMPLVVPGIMTSSKGMTEEWQNKLMGKKIGESTDAVVNAFLLPLLWELDNVADWQVADLCEDRTPRETSCCQGG
jgi:hypothetical protein